ncbi:MAG TPA: 30S ribosomal protein S9 [Patescibacteria group bacterium]|nr:30S ribosomal protein S9 [Patescibacteria group bacterium]
MADELNKKSQETKSSNALASKDKKDFIFAVGKRRESRARVRLYEDIKKYPAGEEKVKKGDMFVNGKKIVEYFSSKVSQAVYNEPFRITNTAEKYVISIKASGGGNAGQLGAVVHGISRALSSMDPKNRAILKKAGFLTRDARTRQRRKVGMGGKSRRKRQSPKR